MRHSGKKRARGVAIARPVSQVHGDGAKAAWICVFLITIVSIVFGQSLGHGFVNYDDSEYVYESSIVTKGITAAGIRFAFTGVHSGNWHPLTTISHMLDCQLFGLNAGMHHLTNLLLHAAAAVLLFLALRELTGALWPSAFVATLFAIHPLRVGSVAWISERKDVLSGMFFMLVLWSYARYARSDKRHARAWYLTALVLFALASMSKPTVVMLPFVLLLLDYWPLRRLAAPPTRSKVTRPYRNRQPAAESLRNVVVEKVPFFLISAASSVATMWAQEKAVITIRQLSFAERVGNALISYATYIGQMFWPARLTTFYPYPEGGLNIAQAMLAFLVLAVITAGVFLWCKEYPFLVVGWLWYLIVLVPMIGIVQVGPQSHADRYTYLPQIGFYILLTWGAVKLLPAWHYRREAVAAVSVLIITALSAHAFVQVSHWRDSEALWNQALASTSRNYVAENGLGNALKEKGRLDEAIVHFRKAIEIYPNYPEGNNNLGHALANQEKWTEAIPLYRTALQAKPNHLKAHNNLGVGLAVTGKTDEALGQFREALRIDPYFADTHANLGHLLLQLGRRDEAIVHLRETLRLNPNQPDIREQLHALGVGY